MLRDTVMLAGALLQPFVPVATTVTTPVPLPIGFKDSVSSPKGAFAGHGGTNVLDQLKQLLHTPGGVVLVNTCAGPAPACTQAGPLRTGVAGCTLIVIPAEPEQVLLLALTV